jgi:hypothetical protein
MVTVNIVRHVKMHHQSPGKDKVYEVIVTQARVGKLQYFHVYARYGRTGTSLKEIEKSKGAISFPKANAMLSALVKKKQNQADSYRIIFDETYPEDASVSPKETPASMPIRRHIPPSPEFLEMRMKFHMF